MVYEKVSTFVSEQFNIEEDDISEEMTFEELGADDFDIAELVRTLEGEFDINLDDEDVIAIEDVGDIIKLIKTALELAG